MFLERAVHSFRKYLRFLSFVVKVTHHGSGQKHLMGF